MRSARMYLAIAALFAAPFVAWGQDAPVATVNGQPIKDSAFVERLKAQFGYATLEQMIEESAIQQAADKAGAKATEEQIMERIRGLAAAIESRSAATGLNLQSWLAGQGLTYAGFKNEVRLQLLVETMVKDQVKVTQQQVSDFYTKSREQLRQPEQMKVSHICVKTSEEAEKIRADIVAKKVTFEDAARQFSIDPYSKNQGGNLDYIPNGEDPLQRAAFALQKDGDISAVTSTRMGFHIIRRDGHKNAGVPPFEEVEARLRSMMERQELAKLAAQRRDDILKAAQIDRKVKLAPTATVPPEVLGGQPAAGPAPAPAPAPAPK